MATTDATHIPKKSTAFRVYFDIRKNDGSLITTWAGMDTELSKDGGNYADATNEATEIQTSGTGYVDLTAAEMGYDCVIVKTTVTNTSALPNVIILYPADNDIDDVASDLTDVAADVTAILAYTGTDGVIVATNMDKTDYELSTSSIDEILDDALIEPTVVPSWSTATLREALSWLLALHRNQMSVTATTQTIRNDADTANIAGASVADDGTTATRGEWTS